MAAVATRVADDEPARLRFERQTGTTEARVVIFQSPEDFDRRGRTQSYQAVFGGRSSRRRLPTVSPDQFDLFGELDQAEMVISDVRDEIDSDGEGLMGDNGLEGAHPARPATQGEVEGSPEEEAQ